MLIRLRIGVATLLLCAAAATQAASVQQNLVVEGQTHEAGKQSQQKVNTLSRETDELLREYQRLLQQADYQEAYNAELAHLLEEQKQELQSLKQQVADVQITRLHIMPFLREKVAELKQFIELDLPFEREARLASVQRLESVLATSSISIAEKFRRVMEAWQTESDYSYELASYRDELQLNGESLSVEFLRIGRTALYFQSLDGKRSGIWRTTKETWQELDSSYNNAIRQGIRVAQKQLPPQLLSLPVVAEEVR